MSSKYRRAGEKYVVKFILMDTIVMPLIAKIRAFITDQFKYNEHFVVVFILLCFFLGPFIIVFALKYFFVAAVFIASLL